jgi:uncharacterized membrane protein YjgN (DUF898 family)
MNATPKAPPPPDDRSPHDAAAYGPPDATPPPHDGSSSEPSTPPPAPATVRHAIAFHGTGGEYFRIWIVNLALTLVTLGIYSAWAKVRKLRYFHGNTELAGSTFGYHGEPLRILKGRAVLAVLLAAYLFAELLFPGAQALVVLLIALVMPWLVVKSRLFSMRMTSWRGLRFDFEQDYAGAYGALLGWGILATLTLGLLYPRFVQKRYEFIVSRTRYGGLPFGIATRTGDFYRAYLVGALVMLGTIAAIGVAWGMGLRPEVGRISTGLAPWAVGIMTAAIALLGYALATSLIEARVLNAVFRGTALGPHRFESELSGEHLFFIKAANTLLIVVTLGLYTPWAQIRLAKYRLEQVTVLAAGDLDAFVAGRAAATPSATGEEIGDFLDVDFGF